MLMETTIKQRNGEHRRIGFFDTESKCWIVERNKKTHYMKTLRGWGLDCQIYNLLRDQYKLERVILTETTSSKVYECYVKTIDENKIFKTFHPHRLQIFIPKIYWKIIDDGRK